MYCKVISPQYKKEYKNVGSISFTTSSGEVEILPGHAESFFKITSGKVSIDSDDNNDKIEVSEGICHVKDNRVFIII